MEDKRFITPILFLVFNRPEMTARTLSAIRNIRPTTLFIAADGARDNNFLDRKNCAEVRRLIKEGVDWDCDLHLLFREQNMGCGEAINSGITWFFKNVTEGIIIEDDCFPHHDFFTFCSDLLFRYRDSDNVFMISGNSILNKYGKRMQSDYCFTAVPSAWGWATWRRSWEKYDFKLANLDGFVEQKKLESIFNKERYRRYWLEYFDEIKKNKINNWDYQLAFTAFNNVGLCARPRTNLISNLGTKIRNGTVTTTLNDSGLKLISHPEAIARDKAADQIIMKALTSPIHRMKRFLKKFGLFYPLKKIIRVLSK